MTRLIFNLVLLSAAIAVVFVYIVPTYENPENGIVALQQKTNDLLEARSQLQALKNKHDELLALESTFSPQELQNLERILPKSINPVLFIMELDTLARNYNMSLKNIKFEEVKDDVAPGSPSARQNQNPYRTFSISFDVTGTYANFSNYLRSVEQSLRIVDITSVALTTSERGDVYQYSVKAQTYWMQ